MHSRASVLGAVPGRQFQSFLRKFRSHETLTPVCFACSTRARFDWQAASLIAGYFPARRASLLDPVVALKLA